MKTTLSLLAVALLAFSSSAQTNTVDTPANAPANDPLSPFTVVNTNLPPSTNILGPQWNYILDFLRSAGTNLAVVPYAIYVEEDSSIGAGLALTYPVSDFTAAVIRTDFLDGEVFMPSASVQLQLPLVLGKVQVTPFTIGGIASPLGGGETDGVVTILGAGLGVRLSAKLAILGDVEQWSGFDGLQYRAGFMWKF